MDPISRQGAIEAIMADKIEGNALSVMVAIGEGKQAETLNQACDRHAQLLKDLPSAQPEIIRCNDCKHWTQTTGNMRGFGLGDCDYINAKLVNCNGFCYWAERRTDEQDSE